MTVVVGSSTGGARCARGLAPHSIKACRCMGIGVWGLEGSGFMKETRQQERTESANPLVADVDRSLRFGVVNPGRALVGISEARKVGNWQAGSMQAAHIGGATSTCGRATF